MDVDVDTFLTTVYAEIDHFCGTHPVPPHRGRPPRMSDSEVLTVLVLGMGGDGHTASLFPGSPLLAQGLDPDTSERCLPMLAPVKPLQRISMTYPLLASARLQLLAIQGADKLKTMEQALSVEPMQMPIRAFLHSPLEIYWCT